MGNIITDNICDCEEKKCSVVFLESTIEGRDCDIEIRYDCCKKSVLLRGCKVAGPMEWEFGDSAAIEAVVSK